MVQCSLISNPELIQDPSDVQFDTKCAKCQGWLVGIKFRIPQFIRREISKVKRAEREKKSEFNIAHVPEAPQSFGDLPRNAPNDGVF
jgi:hypothetical protein